MLTQCPACREWFQVEPDDMEVAYGLVRCGHCRTVFDARAGLRESPRVEESAEEAETETFEQSHAGPFEDVEAPTSATASLSSRKPGGRLRHLWWFALFVVALLLLVQLVNANRRVVAKAPLIGPPVASLYEALGRPIQPRLTLARYSLASAALSGSNKKKHALELRGRLINRAGFVQRLPLIRLTLNDRHGQVLAERLLLPTEYGAATINTLAGGETFSFHVLLADPGDEATGFELVLCKRQAGRVVCRS
jgi:predicted Zn finger-like uncharacterized protein